MGSRTQLGSLGRFAVRVVVFAVALTADASAQSGVQVTPDGSRTLISKDLGGERWAINRNLESGAVTGNVFSPEGGEPQFVYCDELSHDGGQIALRCYGADRCPLVPCETEEEWAALGDVSLPETFFRADRVGATATLEAVHAREAVLGTSGAGLPSGAQVSVPGTEILVSKDVGAERWAISFEPATGVVVGNVFRADGGEPAFVFCRLEVDGDPMTFRCFGADKCPNDECEAALWSELGLFPVPASFLAPPAELDMRGLVEALGAAFGGHDLDVHLNAVEKGYSFRQFVRAAQSGRLNADGSIAARTADVVTPELEPKALFSDGVVLPGTVATAPASPMGGGERPSRDAFEMSLAHVLENSEDLDAAVVELVMLLAANGYTTEQILLDVLANSDRIALVGCQLPFAGQVCRFDEQEFTLLDLATGALLQPIGLEGMRPVQCGNLRLDDIEECDYRSEDVVCDAGKRTKITCSRLCRLEHTPVDDGSECAPLLEASELCGDGRLDRFETCEPATDAQLHCNGVSNTALVCNDDCTATSVACPSDGPRCGNGRIEPAAGERCEQSPRNFECRNPAFTQLFCTEECKWERRSCEDLPEPPDPDPLPWTFTGLLSSAVSLHAEFGSFALETDCPMSVTLREDGTIDGEYACPTSIRTICPDPESGTPGRFTVADSDIVTVVAGSFEPDGSFELDAVNTAVTTPYRGTFSASELHAVRDLGSRQFTNCNLPMTSMNTTALNLTRQSASNVPGGP